MRHGALWCSRLARELSLTASYPQSVILTHRLSKRPTWQRVVETGERHTDQQEDQVRRGKIQQVHISYALKIDEQRVLLR